DGGRRAERRSASGGREGGPGGPSGGRVGGGGHEAVAEADDRLDVVARGPELQPQPADVGVDAAGLHVGVVAPDVLEQPLAGDHAPGALHHVAEQLELLRGEAHLLAAVADEVRVELYLEVL